MSAAGVANTTTASRAAMVQVMQQFGRGRSMPREEKERACGRSLIKSHHTWAWVSGSGGQSCLTPWRSGRMACKAVSELAANPKCMARLRARRPGLGAFEAVLSSFSDLSLGPGHQAFTGCFVVVII